MASLMAILPDMDRREKRLVDYSCGGRCRKKMLKYLQSRPTLIILCTLVIIECMCVLIELMVDLQAIRLRFENEETELNKFIDFLREAYPSQFNTSEEVSLEDVLQELQRAHIVWGAKENSTHGTCACTICNNYRNAPNNLQSQSKGAVNNVNSATTSTIQSSSDHFRTNALEITMQNGDTRTSSKLSNVSELDNKPVIEVNRTEPKENPNCCDCRGRNEQEKIFVIEIHNKGEDFYLVGHMYPDNDSSTYSKDVNSEYYKLHLVSKGLHYGSIGILFLMVCETLVKLVCMGKDFCKQKLEVFDAFIVISSFCLDFVFLGSPGMYETGKDAATILVFFLPWRVIRIVNSFLMTMNHKHHIEMMTIQRAKKKAEQKLVKLQSVLNEIRRDVQLLVPLARSKGATEEEISACIYGQGRAGSTMSAISSFASLMLISTLGKDRGDGDDIYGNVISDALKEDEDEEETAKDRRRSEKKHVRPSIFRQLSSLQEESIANGHLAVHKTPSTKSNGHTSGEIYSICNGHYSGDKDSPEQLDFEPNHNGVSSIGSNSRTSPCCDKVVVEMTSQTTYL